eukprot:6186695-Pleurochrysis_carterae.AAC.3
MISALCCSSCCSCSMVRITLKSTLESTSRRSLIKLLSLLAVDLTSIGCGESRATSPAPAVASHARSRSRRRSSACAAAASVGDSEAEALALTWASRGCGERERVMTRPTAEQASSREAGFLFLCDVLRSEALSSSLNPASLCSARNCRRACPDWRGASAIVPPWTENSSCKSDGPVPVFSAPACTDAADARVPTEPGRFLLSESPPPSVRNGGSGGEACWPEDGTAKLVSFAYRRSARKCLRACPDWRGTRAEAPPRTTRSCCAPACTGANAAGNDDAGDEAAAEPGRFR